MASTARPRVGGRYGLRHAVTKLPEQLTALASSVRTALRSPLHTLWSRARPRKGWRVCALGQRWRRLAAPISARTGGATGARVRHWMHEQNAGWYVVCADPQMPVTSPLRDQAHHALDRQLCLMQGCHHPNASQQAFLRGRAPRYNLVPYQRRAQHAGQCGVAVEGGKVPTQDGFLHLRILTSGG
jgi:hypothetical protein